MQIRTKYVTAARPLTGLAASLLLGVQGWAAPTEHLEWMDLDQLANVVVTVTRHEETINAVSARVEVVPGTSAEESGADSLLAIGRHTVSLEFSRVVNIPYAFSRGVGSDLPSIAVDTSTALHLDGVYLGLPDMAIPLFWDLDRVEILSGPQGSLYGRNASAGVVNIINRRPELGLTRTELSAQAGTHGLFAGEVRFNYQTDGTSALRLSLLHRSDHGYTTDLDPRGTNQIDDHEAVAARLQWLKGNLATGYFLVGADYYRDHSGSNTSRPMDNFGAAFPTAIPTVPGETRNNLPTYAHILSSGVRLEGMRQLDEWRVSGIVAWRHLDNRYLHNLDGTEIDITNSDSNREIKQLSADLSATHSTPEQSGGRWIIGTNLYSSHAEYDVGLIRPPLGFSIVFISPLKNKAASAFAEWERRWAGRWTLTLGSRYSFETKHLTMQRYTAPGLDGLASDLSALAPVVATDFNRKWAKLTPRAVLDYKASDAQHFYASLTNGFKSGGMNSVSADRPVQPEDVWSFELGHRYHPANSSLEVSTTVFHTEYRNLQVNSYVNSGASVSNAASAKVDGLEFNFQKQLTERFNLLGEATLLNARYGSYTAVQGVLPFVADGNQLPHAPRWTTKISGHYHVPFATGQLSARVTWSARAKTYFNALEDDIVAEKEISLWDASLTWYSKSSWWVRLSGQNLGNLRYNDNVVRFTSSTSAAHPEGNALGYPAPGRTVLFSIGVAF